jgi:glycosyltransferase involved in cell wall biosynthesis
MPRGFVGIIQFWNEMPENLPRAVRSLRRFCTHVVGYDDASTDGSREWATENLDHLFCGEVNDWEAEVSHKSMMLEEAKKYAPDWFFWLDADEEVSPGAVDALLHQPIGRGVTGLRLHSVHLWKSQTMHRVDEAYNAGDFLRAWRNVDGLCYPPAAVNSRRLHQSQFPPQAAKNAILLDRDAAPIVHYSWDTAEKIAAKYNLYKSHGQSGKNLSRCADGPGVIVEPTKEGWFW